MQGLKENLRLLMLFGYGMGVLLLFASFLANHNDRSIAWFFSLMSGGLGTFALIPFVAICLYEHFEKRRRIG